MTHIFADMPQLLAERGAPSDAYENMERMTHAWAEEWGLRITSLREVHGEISISGVAHVRFVWAAESVEAV